MKSQGVRSEPLREGELIEEVVKKQNQPDAVVTYRRGKMLGKGSFGYCYEIVNLETNAKSAVKIIPKESLAKSKVKSAVVSEIQIHRELQHDNIVRIEQAFEDKQNIYIKMELCLNKNLSGLLKRRKYLTEEETKYFIHQVASVLLYLRDSRILHRDLKLSNLFLGQKMDVKVGDFGLAVKMNNLLAKRRSICGTPNYIAPEILEEKPYSYEVDVWSTGIIMFTLLFGRAPFQSETVKQTYETIKFGQLRVPSKDGVSAEAKDLICKMLERDVSRRITPEQILEHDFFKSPIPKMLTSSILYTPPTKFIYESPTLALNPGPLKFSQLKKLNLLKLVQIISTSPSPSDSKSKSQSAESSGTEKANGNFSTDETDKKQSNEQQSDRAIEQDIKQCGSVRIIRWSDYTHKYGFAYLLSNGNIGVVFNDESIMTLDVLSQNYYYIAKSAQQGEVLIFPEAAPPKSRDVNKKLVIIGHFRSLFQKDIDSGLIDQQSQQTVYVSKFRKTGHSALFRLSNKLIQVLFTDKSEILISCKNQNRMAYIDPQGELFYEPLSTALRSKNGELINRLTHTKELVKSLIPSHVCTLR